MKIIQVATLLTPDNAYGGPTTVALNQCRALLDAGHDVTLAAGARGYGRVLPQSLHGVPLRLFETRQAIPRTGFAGVAAPAMLPWLRKHARAADAVHIHLARDLVTLPAAALALRSGSGTYAQTHGMIDPSGRMLAGPLDAALTRRVLRAADRVFYLTDDERSGLRAVAGPAIRAERLPNGIPLVPISRDARDADRPTVLYLARLQERKRPLSFVAMASVLAHEFPGAAFVMVGPDEGQGAEVAEAIAATGLGDRLRWVGSRDRAGCEQAMREADIYVLPSVDEPYPMSVLEAMAFELPVVITDSCGLAEAVQRGGAGTVVGRDPREIVPAVRELLANPTLRSEMGAQARGLVRSEFAMSAIRDQLVSAYQGTRAQ